MKVLIVDDESHVREGVRLALAWREYGYDTILEAEEGYSALKIVREHKPELIICDMSMPYMDGVTFLKELRNEGWDSKVIALSGYQEFRYTRATLLAEGSDYLLKPFKVSDLTKAVQSATASIQANQRQLHKNRTVQYHLIETNTMQNEKKIANYLQSEDVMEDDLLLMLQQYTALSPESFYITLYLPRNLDLLITRKFKGDESLFYFALRNILSEILEPIDAFYFFPFDPFLCILINGTATTAEVEFYQQKLKNSWKNIMQLHTLCANSSTSIGYKQMVATIEKVQTTILQSNLLEEQHQTQTISGLNKNSAPTFFEQEILLIEALRTQNKQYLFAQIERFVTELSQLPSLSLLQLQQYTMEMNLLIIRISHQLEYEQPLKPLSIWISDLTDWKNALLSSFQQLFEFSGDKLTSLQHIHTLKHFIDNNLNQKMSITELAEKFHFSPQYISKRFKETYGVTIMNYVTDQKMEKAGSLLRHSDLSIQQIAQTVGYDDENYFSKVFKKQFGTSPSEYRKHTVKSDI